MAQRAAQPQDSAVHDTSEAVPGFGAVTLHTGLMLQPPIGGTSNQASMSIPVDEECHAFYTVQPLEEALKAFPATEEGLASFIELFRGVRCYMRHDKTLSVVIEDWTDELIRDMEVTEADGAKLEPPISMKDAFMHNARFTVDADRRAIRVGKHFPNKRDYKSGLPRHLKFVQLDAYPLEALFIMPAQPVKRGQMSDELQRVIQSKIDAMDKSRRPEDLDRRLEEMLSTERARRMLAAFGVTMTVRTPR